MKKRILALLLVALMALALIPAAHAEWIMYVSPAKGTTVNLRTTPDASSKANNLITKVPYGTPLTVLYISGDWSCIDYSAAGYPNAYMMVKYLSYDYIAPSPANQKTTPNQDTAAADNSDLASHYRKMNEQFATFHLLDRSFIVYGKPERATGWSNLRYAPNEKATLIRRVYRNEQLIVIGETARWYQVQDPTTGITGYISRFYVTTTPN